MKVGNAAGRILAVLTATGTLGMMAGCENRNPDINQVQPGYVRKAIFQTGNEWHYRRTVAKSETTNSLVIEGSGDIFLDRVKFEVQEHFLLAYKPYENIPGAQTQEIEGGGINEFFKGVVVAAWHVESHFDIQRNYDPVTGNVTNVIAENSTDRPWSERDYMRVDYANNVINNASASQFWGPDTTWGLLYPVEWFSTGKYWTNLETRPTDPFASRFQDDYVEVTESVLLGMDVFTCAAFVGYSLAGYPNCGYGEAKVRHSFTRIDKASDYIPRDYPDSYVRKDAAGKPIYDDETGEVSREAIYDRFGVFRLEIPTYDRGYGNTESGRLFRAAIFNLWERHTDDQGNVLAESARTPDPIIYYLNAEYPPRYLNTAADVAADYDRIYSSMTADLMGVSVMELRNRIADGKRAPYTLRDDGAGMYQIRQNDCNEDNIISFVSNNEDLLFAVERAVCVDGTACDVTTGNLADKIGVGNLKTVCTSLEAATIDPMTGKSQFEWQRIGDNRYKMVVWLNNPQQSGWGGYGPMHADGRTGESVSASAYLRGFSYEVGASNVVDYIEFINDEKSVSEIVFGQDVRRHASQTAARRATLSNTRPNQAMMQSLRGRIDNYGPGREALTRNEQPNDMDNRLARARGTRVEDKLITDLSLGMASDGAWKPGDDVTEELLERASPFGLMTQQDPNAATRAQARAALGAAGFCFLKAEFDPSWEGLAEQMKDMCSMFEGDPNFDPECRAKRYAHIADRLVKHVMLHELGHNLGLAHNFEGSYDALNYPDQFWDLHWADATQKVTGRYEEYRHTTVMEYLSMKGAFADFLGKYDEAAIRFAYGNQVQVFDDTAVDTNLVGGEELRNWRYLNDYNRVPHHLCDATDGGDCSSIEVSRSVIRNRKWVNFDHENPPVNEVPYLFCDNSYNRVTPFCATFDYGSSLSEIFANYYSMWSDYYFFNNFKRDRLSPLAWSPRRAMGAVYFTYNYIDTVAQWFYYLSAANSDFRGSALEADMVNTLGSGLNMAAEIIATPQPRRMCPWPGSDPTVYLDNRFLNDCDEYADLNSQYAIDGEQIQPPLGDARPTTIGFTGDYEDYSWEFVGSYFDKINVMYMLGYTRPTLFRFNYDLDERFYQISLYRIFEEELDDFYGKLFGFDGFFLNQQTAVDLGSFWCRDETAPDVAHLGHFEPRKIMDVSTGAMLPGPSASCVNPAYIYPDLLANMPYTAMFAAHALYSSDFDAQRDMGKKMKVYVVGSDDDFTAWANFANCETAAAGETCFCSITDDLTGLEYRGINQAGAEVESPACTLVSKAQDAQDNYDESSGNPFYKDNWRQWIERLEYARDLYRMYHSR